VELVENQDGDDGHVDFVYADDFLGIGKAAALQTVQSTSIPMYRRIPEYSAAGKTGSRMLWI
jgi:hypothetical protein